MRREFAQVIDVVEAFWFETVTLPPYHEAD
jgi:hypothetical protein